MSDWGESTSEGHVVYKQRATYLREMAHARRDIEELRKVVWPRAVTITNAQLAEAIGLATMARDALLRAAAAREKDE